jgi:hypothetical protein
MGQTTGFRPVVEVAPMLYQGVYQSERLPFSAGSELARVDSLFAKGIPSEGHELLRAAILF